MKSILTLFILSTLFIGCSKDKVIFESWTEDTCIQNFVKENELLLSYESNCKPTYLIYRFEGTYFFVFGCCFCDYYACIVDCNHDIYAGHESQKYKDFFETAVIMDALLIENTNP